jgi:hypothetical protein
VEAAFARYLALLSVARRSGADGGPSAPLFAIEVQLWVREVSRLLRTVAPEPRFRWFDSPPAERDEDAGQAEPRRQDPELPAAYCRHCGRAGWMAFVSELDGSLMFDPVLIYRASVQQPARVRVLLRASTAERDARHLDPAAHRLVSDPGEGTIAVLATPGEAEARRHTCPSCDQDDGIRFLGAQVASLASVCVSQLFGSPLVHPEERKLLAFTDSVQDAAHRAAFFSGRTYRFNLRTLMAELIEDAERISLQELGDSLLEATGGDPAALHALTPPDLLEHPRVRTLWEGRPERAGWELLATRLAFEAALELGLRARIGRTLELTGTVAAAVEPRDPQVLAELVGESHRHLAGQGVLDTDMPGYGAYLRVARLDRGGACAARSCTRGSSRTWPRTATSGASGVGVGRGCRRSLPGRVGPGSRMTATGATGTRSTPSPRPGPRRPGWWTGRSARSAWSRGWQPRSTAGRSSYSTLRRWSAPGPPGAAAAHMASTRASSRCTTCPRTAWLQACSAVISAAAPTRLRRSSSPPG